ncbi:4'-phosphopantetheinyl transferase superfamily protein [Nonomuraea longispora]|uniref:4'-phosphopantetheinyl transferase superfamily protein n=1 Tax=Nonomuraea longispora TaxID=1848320 RepID=A0A4R4NAL0_9ACTN|nr:4'-phosphopantetheinyl transferase superfamily protein [Nonomuraea longispora]TDC04037.1 4'-phosphopantetheinyl transferase superfamily protein [Nonomuraea longispora]
MNVLMGVDALQPERVERAMARWGEAYSAKVCSEAELSEWGSRPAGVAACLAVKECLIKAVGGRTYPFDWHGLNAGGPACPAARDLLEDAAGAFGAATGAVSTRLTGCAVRARGLRGAALWGHSGDHIVAMAVLVEEGTC